MLVSCNNVFKLSPVCCPVQKMCFYGYIKQRKEVLSHKDPYNRAIVTDITEVDKLEEI